MTSGQGTASWILYFGFKVMDPTDQKMKVIIDYANNVLNATGLRYGNAVVEAASSALPEAAAEEVPVSAASSGHAVHQRTRFP